MFNTPKHQLIQQGHQLANDLDQSLTRLAHQPVPAEWGPALSYYETLGDLVKATRHFDSQADLLLR